jgi:hypothetical protein
MGNPYAAGGLLRGISDGISVGNQMIDAYQKNVAYTNQQDVKNVMQKGLADAQQARSDDISANSQTGSAPNADNSMTVPTYTDTHGNTYANADEQAAAAKKNAPGLDELYLTNVAPKVKETYLAQGNQAAADQWDQWMQDKSTRTALGHLSKATIAGQMGDFKGYADNMVRTYNTPGYYEDGIHADGYDLIKDKDGNTTGINLNLTNKASGEKFTQKVNGTQDMLNMGIAALDPQKGFALHMAQNTAAQGAQYKTQLEDHKTSNEMVRDTNKVTLQTASHSKLEDQKAGNALNLQATGKQLDQANAGATLNSKIATLKANGYDEGFIKAALPQILGIGQYKKPADPQEVRRMLFQARMNSDFSFKGMSPQKQAALIDQDVNTINAGTNPMSGGLPGGQTAGAPQQWPPAQGWSPQGQPQASAVPVSNVPMIYDTKTGQMVPYQ